MPLMASITDGRVGFLPAFLRPSTNNAALIQPACVVLAGLDPALLHRGEELPGALGQVLAVPGGEPEPEDPAFELLAGLGERGLFVTLGCVEHTIVDPGLRRAWEILKPPLNSMQVDDELHALVLHRLDVGRDLADAEPELQLLDSSAPPRCCRSRSP